jgi:chemotaxis signal transduction protein
MTKPHARSVRAPAAWSTLPSEAAARRARARADRPSPGRTAAYLEFWVEEIPLAVLVTHVAGVYRPGKLLPIPQGSHRTTLGMVDIRGEVCPLLSGRALVSGRAAHPETDRIDPLWLAIHPQPEGKTYALSVTGAKGVFYAEAQAPQEPSGGPLPPHVSHVVKRADELLFVLNVSLLLNLERSA